MSFLRINNKLPKLILLLIAAVLFIVSIATSFYLRSNPSVSFEEKKLERYIKEQEKDFQQFLNDTALIRSLYQKQESIATFEKLAQKPYGIYLAENTAFTPPKLLFWNTQLVLPPYEDTTLKDDTYFKHLSNGYYLIVKRSISITNNYPVNVYAVIPILYNFNFQQSDYLQTHFAYDNTAHKRIGIVDKTTDFPIRDISGKILFYIERRANAAEANTNLISAFFRILSLVLLFAFIYFISISFRQQKGALRGTLFLLAVLLFLRIVLFVFPDIFLLREIELFDPTIYSSNWLNRSLGDLLLNVFFFCWFVIFVWHNLGHINYMPKFIYGVRLKSAAVLALVLLILSAFQFAEIVRSLIADSKISFNVIDFFSLDVYTFIGLIILALLSLAFYYWSRILYRFIFFAFGNHSILIYFSIALAGLLLLTFKSDNRLVIFQLPILGWLVVYTLLVSQEKFIINKFRVTTAGVLFWIFIFSISLSGIILQENREKELRIRKGIAEKYDQLSDPAGELTMSIALAYIDNDFLRDNFFRFKSAALNEEIRDSIIRGNMSGYITRYDTKIFVFNEANQPLNNSESLTYTELNSLYTEQSRPTGIPDLNYHETSYDQFIYITKRTIIDSVKLGTLFIISTPKRYNQDAIYPELFRRINDTDPENSPIYSYAIYKNNLLIASSSKYPFKINLAKDEVPKQEFLRIINNDFDELWYRASGNKVVVIAKKQDTLMERITLFSYLFCAFLFLVALLQLIVLILRAGDNWKVLNIFGQLNIRSQVHSTIIFISIFSFLIIGIATISFFISRYNRNNIDKLSRTSGIMVKEMKKRLNEYGTFDDIMKIYDPGANADLKKLIDEVSDIHDVDVNVYDLEGNLQVSSEDEVYERGILSTKMHPKAFYHLQRLRQVQYVQEESMSSLNYLSIYAAVPDAEGKVYAYLNIPYFLSQIDLNQEISNFLITIINLNAFIFLIAGVIALFITNRITRSFSIIGDKMKAIQLGKTNEEILWDRNDEIGELVTQYNKMVQQLEQSASALAKSEREGAWREMARQVAHEIKNPLTPMKLSIQYLQKAINNNQPNVKELTTNVANTLVEQIDHLSKIAADFARFANIGIRQLENFDLHQVLESLKDLHSSNTKVSIIWNRLPRPLYIRADKTHMNRLFTNLITNAIDACTQNAFCQIVIDEIVNENNVIIKLRDNGEGIPDEMRNKIFTPNFTTKSSGTGLGLAMSKSIVEQANGEIWFETESGKGTTFFVQLPLIQSL